MQHWSLPALVAMVMTFSVAGAAQASPVTFAPDTFNPNDVFFLKNAGGCVGNNTLDLVSGSANGGCETLEYVHELTGFDSSTDTLTSGSLSLVFYDDSNDGNAEVFDLALGSVGFLNNVTIRSGSTAILPFGISVDVLASVTHDGLLSVVLSRGNQGANNDFFFASSTLNASGSRDLAPAPVPEPASLLLVGTGLLTVGWRFRQRRQA
jgi:hypothetical protein